VTSGPLPSFSFLPLERKKEKTNQERLNTMTRVSDEIIRFRNKRVPDVSELKDLHHLVDRIHHSMGYLMVLGQQPPITNERVLKAEPPAPSADSPPSPPKTETKETVKETVKETSKKVRPRRRTKSLSRPKESR